MSKWFEVDIIATINIAVEVSDDETCDDAIAYAKDVFDIDSMDCKARPIDNKDVSKINYSSEKVSKIENTVS